uniref:Putative secreted protein n=1 Tax=Anopheles marajoara TaxID=58244 RepID=A0A2M4CCV2_9DIPT
MMGWLVFFFLTNPVESSSVPCVLFSQPRRERVHRETLFQIEQRVNINEPHTPIESNRQCAFFNSALALRLIVNQP